MTVLLYVLQNPVRTGLSDTVHEWPWSSTRRSQLVDRSPVDEENRSQEQLESRLDEVQVAIISESPESAAAIRSIGMASGDGK
jgi:hypothetical protein